MARKFQTGARTSGYTVLVIDDSVEILESSRRLLEAEGHHVLTAPNGAEGLAVLDRERVHLILCDYFMPEMTGEEVVRKVRERNRLVQIILVTGYSGEKPARVMMRELDIQGYHDKGEGAERLLLGLPGELVPAAGEERTASVRLGDEQHRGCGVGELAEPGLALPQRMLRASPLVAGHTLDDLGVRPDPAFGNITQVESTGGVEVVHRSFQLDPTRPVGATINRREMLMSKYRLTPSQVDAMDARMEQTAAAEGLVGSSASSWCAGAEKVS